MYAQLSDGRTMVKTAGAPHAMFAHLTLGVYQVSGSTTGRYHSQARCRSLKGRGKLTGRVVVDAASFPDSKVCNACLHHAAPPDWRDVLDAAQQVATLALAARRLYTQVIGGQEPALNDVATVTTGYENLDTVRADLATALTDTGADRAAQDAADDWVDTVAAAAADALTALEPVLAGDPDRQLRAAARRLVSAFDEGFHSKRHQCLSGENTWRMHGPLLASTEDVLADMLASGADLADVRASVLAVLKTRKPQTLHALPRIPVKAGKDLRKVVTKAWRKAARAQLADLLDARLAEYTTALADTAPAVLVTGAEPDDDGHGLLVGYPYRAANGNGMRAYLVPSVIGRGVERTHTQVVLANAPLPAPLRPGYTDADAAAVLAGPYVTALLSLADELDPDDAVTAALGVAHTAPAA